MKPLHVATMRCALACRLLAAALVAVSPWAAAQDYPSHPVRLIVPFAVGGPADVYARCLTKGLQESMGQPFIVDTGPAPARSSAPTRWPRARPTATRCS